MAFEVSIKKMNNYYHHWLKQVKHLFETFTLYTKLHKLMVAKADKSVLSPLFLSTLADLDFS